MNDETEFGVQGTAGISRRDMMRKSAVVGGAGALMWAAPSITKFGGAAFGTEGTPMGLVSWVIVWFDCGEGKDKVRVKYESNGSYKIDPSGKPSQNFGCPGLFDDTQAKYAYDEAGVSPDGVTVSTGTNGELEITTSDCTIVAWVLHDGSCGTPKEGISNCRSSEAGDTTVGPATPAGPDAYEAFQWTKCA